MNSLLRIACYVNEKKLGFTNCNYKVPILIELSATSRLKDDRCLRHFNNCRSLNFHMCREGCADINRRRHETPHFPPIDLTRTNDCVCGFLCLISEARTRNGPYCCDSQDANLDSRFLESRAFAIQGFVFIRKG